MRLRLSKLATAIGDECRVTANGSFDIKISSNTRTLEAGDIFIALSGANFDGHDYIQAAIDQGAAAIIAQRNIPPDFPAIQVPDTVVALQKIAGLWRKRWGGKLVAVTGSCGKTSVKDMLGQMLQPKVYATSSNDNNLIGVAQSLLALERKKHKIAVIEIGTNQRGEIAQSAEISKPYISIITNANLCHSSGIGDLNNIAREKGDLISATDRKGWVILNRDDPHFDYWKKLATPRRVLSFALKREADFYPRDFYIENHTGHSKIYMQSPLGTYTVNLAWPATANVANALAATAATYAHGMESGLKMKLFLEMKLENLHLAHPNPTPRRLQLHFLPHNGLLIDDSYNASPASLRSALDYLSELNPYTLKKVVVLGNMLELGKYSIEQHRAMAEYLDKLGLTRVFTYGKWAKLVQPPNSKGRNFATRAELIKYLIELYQSKRLSNRAILVKASRGEGFDVVADELLKAARADTY